MSRNWAPFTVVPRGEHAPAPRSIHTVEGVCDRLRAAAFAEIQAREAFLWAAQTLTDAPASLSEAWRLLAAEEDKHLGWLLRRLEALGQAPGDRGVSDQLWISLTACGTAQEFALFMATAEDRGRRAGERFHEQLASQDPESSRIFGQIALEEVEHIRLAERHFGFKPGEVEARAQKNA
jgi:uncharacterized ferritin-like protein (DUF455 family)